MVDHAKPYATLNDADLFRWKALLTFKKSTNTSRHAISDIIGSLRYDLTGKNITCMMLECSYVFQKLNIL